MERYSRFIVLLLTVTFFSCKKGDGDNMQIAVEDVYVQAVKTDRVEINYTLSSFGYEETGVAYAKKSNPSQLVYVKAIRVDGLFKLALQALESNTDYIFRVYFGRNNERVIDAKEYSVRTLIKEAQLFKLQVVDTVINYDENGNFITYIEGDNLNDINLAELEIKLGYKKLTFSYPVLVSGSKYRIKVNGIADPFYKNNVFIANYQGKEIMFQSVPFVFDGERFWLTYKPTNFRGYYTTVFGADLYYFYDDQVFRWDDAAQRMVSVTNIPFGTIQPNSVGIEFDARIFFPATPHTNYPNPRDISEFNTYPEAYCFEVATKKWKSFPFIAQDFGKANRQIENAKYFIHKNELYLSYSIISDEYTVNRKQVNFLFHYNKSAKEFESAEFNLEIINYTFVSVDNRLFLSGMAPVYDQGFKVSATFVVYEVADNFSLKEIYRGGTVADPLSIVPRYTVAYEQKILVGLSTNNFLLFDPSNKQLYQVYLKNNVSHTYFNGFFTYNNKLHLNADLSFTSHKIYEISIVKGR
ncbi:MAG: hypothetical protein EOO42_02050 [Flavobacteriales bacterium]|nr:MAG: hypothetical protein EOO42_02050 [Flavobacteriales bacterium]